jgi:hypothetical protein
VWQVRALVWQVRALVWQVRALVWLRARAVPVSLLEPVRRERIQRLREPAYLGPGLLELAWGKIGMGGA